MFRVSMLVGAIALLLLAACTRVAPTPAPTGTPTASAEQRDITTPTPASLITQEQATESALQAVTRPMPEVTVVENPRNPVARLMTLREYQERIGGGSSFLTDPDTLVWVVQVEGESYSAGIAAVPRTQYSYATVVIDAQNGTIITMSRTYAPLFPTEA